MHEREGLLLQASGAMTIESNSKNRFQTGTYPNGKSVRIAFYGLRFGGWQFEFTKDSRDLMCSQLIQAGFSTARNAPSDTTKTRVALGTSDAVATAAIRYLVDGAMPTFPREDDFKIPYDAPPSPPHPAWPPADIASLAAYYTADECAEFAAKGFTAAQVGGLLGL